MRYVPSFQRVCYVFFGVLVAVVVGGCPDAGQIVVPNVVGVAQTVAESVLGCRD